MHLVRRQEQTKRTRASPRPRRPLVERGSDGTRAPRGRCMRVGSGVDRQLHADRVGSGVDRRLPKKGPTPIQIRIQMKRARPVRRHGCARYGAADPEPTREEVWYSWHSGSQMRQPDETAHGDLFRVAALGHRGRLAQPDEPAHGAHETKYERSTARSDARDGARVGASATACCEGEL